MIASLISAFLIAASPVSSPSTLRTSFQELQNTKKEVILEYRSRLQAAQQQREEYKQEFKEKLDEIKDERKKIIAQDLEEKINSTNSRWVEKFGDALDRLENILTKVEEKSGDTQTVLNAKDKLNTAKEAVNTQASKIYKIEFTSEDNLGQAVRTTINDLHQDLKLVRESIQEARSAVVEAVSEWNNSNQNSNENE